MRREKILKRVLFVFLSLLLCVALVMNSDYYHAKRLMSAIRENDVDKVEKIALVRPTCVNCWPYIAPQWWHSFMGFQCFYPLEYACYIGSYENAKALLEAGADVNAVNPYIESTALLSALSPGHPNDIEIAFLLIEHGADINAQRPQYYSVFQLSIMLPKTYSNEYLAKQAELFDYLFDNCDLSKIDMKEEFVTSGSAGNLYAARRILEAGLVDIDVRNARGDTALMCAAYWGNCEMISFLLERGANKSLTDADGNTAYDLALQEGHPEAAELLTPENAPHRK